MDYLSYEEKRNLIAHLIDLAKADGNVSMPEMTYLIWVAQKLNISQTELMDLTNGKRPFFHSVPSDQRLEQFHKMLNMVFVDGNVDDSELESCRAIAYQIGLDRPKVDKLLAMVKADPKTIVDFETLKASFEGF